MSRRRAYKRTNVKKINVEVLSDTAIRLGNAGTAVGLDVGKDEIVACLRWPDGSFERPWSVGNPDQIGDLLEVLKMLDSTCDSLTVGLESTGTYGEAVRRALTIVGIDVQRIGGKASSDYKEIFDGVPSQHDGKDAAVIAELTAFGKGTAWPYKPESETFQRVKHQMARLDAYRKQQTQWSGRLEGLLAGHWPELTRLLKLESITLLKMIVHYRSPARVAADPQAAGRLRGWGKSKLTESKITQLIESARTTRGIPMDESQAAWAAEVAENVLSAHFSGQDADAQLRDLIAAEATMARYSEIGAGTLAAIWTQTGNPRDYSSGGAFLKALGLNLKERSSGRRKGELAITKRAPGQARRWLYFWALRAIQRPELKQWYADFTRVGRKSGSNAEHRKMKALVALMRKLSRALRHVMVHEIDFDYSKLFEEERSPSPGRRRRKRSRRRSAATT